MPYEENKSIVRRLLEEVWGQGRYSTIRELVSPDIEDHDPGPGQPCGLEGQEFAARGFLGALSNYKLTIDNLVGQGDRVFDRWTFTATQTGDFFGMPPTGRRFTITGIDESRLKDGKIVEIWHREDLLSMMQQLGAAPTPSLPQSFGRPYSGPGGSYGKPPSEGEIRDRIRRAFQQMLDRGDLNAVDEFLAPDFVGHYSAFPTVYGREGFREFISIYNKGLSDRHTDIEDIVVDGDRVAVRALYHGKNTGAMMGMAPTGKTVAVKSLSIFRMVGDKAAEQWANNDDFGMMQQLGVVPQMAVPEPVPC